MKSARLALGCVGVIVPVLAGCGSSTSPPFTLACTTHKLPTGFIRANVTVTNTTDKAGKVFVYGPALASVSHVYPAFPLSPTTVVVRVSHTQQTYIGFVIPRIAPKKAAYLILRLTPTRRAQSILVGSSRVIRAPDWSILNNPDCRIRKRS